MSSSGSDDISLGEFLSQLGSYQSVIPDQVTAHYLKKSGLEAFDQRVVRLTSLAAQKFISDILNDSMQYSKMRQLSQTHTSKKTTRDKKNNLAVEDLQMALADRRIELKKPPYFVG